MSASEYIVKPLVDQLVNDIVMRHERKQREAKKLEPTGMSLLSPINHETLQTRSETSGELAATCVRIYWRREPVQMSGRAVHQVLSQGARPRGAYQTLSPIIELLARFDAEEHAKDDTATDAQD